MKKIGLIILCMVIGLSPIQEDFQDLQEKNMNNNVVIAFDLHEVIFKFSLHKLSKSLYHFFRKNPYIFTLCNPFAGYRIYKVFKTHSPTAENIYTQLTDQHYAWLADSRPEFINICNSYVLDQGMHELLKELKNNGYRLAICSNIGHHAYHEFRKEYPEIFDMFEIVVTSHPERNYLRKPAAAFFEHLKQEVKKVTVSDDVKIIFIDDKKKNAHAADQAGICGVIFKNPTQLRNELKKQGVTRDV